MLLAAFFLSLCCFHYPAGSAMPQTTAYNQKILLCSSQAGPVVFWGPSRSLLSAAERADLGDVVLLRLAGPVAVWVGSLSRLSPVLFLAFRESCPISVYLLGSLHQTLITFPEHITFRDLNERRRLSSLPRDFLLLMDAQHEGWWGGEMSFGAWGPRSGVWVFQARVY